MSLKNMRTSYDQVEPGQYPAWLVAIVDLGTHEENYQGNVKHVPKVFLVWELAGSGQLFGHGVSAYLSGQAKLRMIVEDWIGKPLGKAAFDLTSLFTWPCVLTLVTDDTGKYTHFDSVTAYANPNRPVAPTHRPLFWEIDSGQLTALKDLPWWLGKPAAEWVKQSAEWQEKMGMTQQGPAVTTGTGRDRHGRPLATSPAQQTIPETTAGPIDPDEIPF